MVGTDKPGVGRKPVFTRPLDAASRSSHEERFTCTAPLCSSCCASSGLRRTAVSGGFAEQRCITGHHHVRHWAEAEGAHAPINVVCFDHAFDLRPGHLPLPRVQAVGLESSITRAE